MEMCVKFLIGSLILSFSFNVFASSDCKDAFKSSSTTESYNKLREQEDTYLTAVLNDIKESGMSAKETQAYLESAHLLAKAFGFIESHKKLTEAHERSLKDSRKNELYEQSATKKIEEMYGITIATEKTTTAQERGLKDSKENDLL